MTTLSEWLEAQIAEDERIAREAVAEGSTEWRADLTALGPRRTGAVILDGNGLCVIHHDGEFGGEEAAHIARWDPARVLAECNAKRRIIDLHNRMHECSTLEDNGDVNSCTWVYDEDCTTLRALAAVFEGRPGYQETWEPA